MGRGVVNVMHMVRPVRGRGGTRTGCRARARRDDPSIARAPSAVPFSIRITRRVGVGRRRLATCTKYPLSWSSGAQGWAIFRVWQYIHRSRGPARKRHGTVIAWALLFCDVVIVSSTKARVGAIVLIHRSRATWWSLQCRRRCLLFCAEK